MVSLGFRPQRRCDGIRVKTHVFLSRIAFVSGRSMGFRCLSRSRERLDELERQYMTACFRPRWELIDIYCRHEVVFSHLRSDTKGVQPGISIWRGLGDKEASGGVDR
jgi:hypothetical protein